MNAPETPVYTPEGGSNVANAIAQAPRRSTSGTETTKRSRFF
jgi:hypothetical protein